MKLIYKPLTPKLWRDFVALFSETGVQNGCWCMWWRLTRENFHRRYGRGNKAAFKKIVDSGRVPGIIAYQGRKPVGWVAVAPREEFPSLDRSPVLKRVDDRPVWSINCFFVSKPYRGQGVNGMLARAAVDHVRKNGGRIVEAYPVRRVKNPDTVKWLLYSGLADTFRRLGFKTVSRKSKVRLMMRYYINNSQQRDAGRKNEPSKSPFFAKK
jgi:GNAT superfamily N-acetyltransferase